MSAIYDQGNVIRLAGAFTDVNGAVIDPGVVTLRVKLPSGSVSVFSYPADIARDGAGAYHYDFTPATHGDYYYRFEGSSGVVAAAEAMFTIRNSQIL